VRSNATTVEDYLAELPEDRRAAVSAVREVVNANLPEGYEETMEWVRTLEEVPLDVIGEAVARVPVAEFVALYESSRRGR